MSHVAVESEWVGAAFRWPEMIRDAAGKQFHPTMLIWLDVKSHEVVGHAVFSESEAPSFKVIATHWRNTTMGPLNGSPRTPERLRVASPSLAEELASELQGQTQVICAPTPEIDSLKESIFETLRQAENTSYLSAELNDAALSSMFETAAQLFTAAPWQVFPNDKRIFSFAVPALGISEGVLSILGEADGLLGLLLFRTLDEFKTHVSMAFSGTSEEVTPGQAYFVSFGFERGANLSASLRKEISQHNWPVASVNGYPVFWAMDGSRRALSGNEFGWAQAVAAALAKMSANQASLDHADPSDPASQDVSLLSFRGEVSTYRGNLEVTLVAPHPQLDWLEAATSAQFDFFAQLRDSDRTLDPTWLEWYSDQLVERFLASEWGKAYDEGRGVAVFLELLAHEFNVTAAQLKVDNFAETVLDSFIEQGPDDAELAAGLFVELRDFLKFLQSDYGLASAQECIELLDDPEFVATFQEELRTKSERK